MRRSLVDSFSTIYHLDLRGNARTTGAARKSEAGNIFEDKIRVGVGITLLVRAAEKQKPARLFVYRLGDFLSSEAKCSLVRELSEVERVPWREYICDAHDRWRPADDVDDFDTFVSLHSGADTQTVFQDISNGVKTNRDAWAYNFRSEILANNIARTIEFYNSEIDRWARSDRNLSGLDDFVRYDDSSISWSRDLKLDVTRFRYAEFDQGQIRLALYRPFTKMWLYFDRIFNEEVYRIQRLFPSTLSEQENLSIVATIDSQIDFSAQMASCIPCIHVGGRPSQCFPFYTYDEDGSKRRENITDWALLEFRRYYGDDTITKWDIFHYVYAVLHHPGYRERYAANLKRELPRIPFVPATSAASVFRSFVAAGRNLAELHVNYEQQAEYPLERIENPNEFPNYRVEKMRLGKDKTALRYNNFLTLSGIPPAVYEYRLGNRSALEWVIDQYQVSTDKRSGITNDPNREDDPEYIVHLIGQVVTVSLETVKIVNHLRSLAITEQTTTAVCAK